VKLRAVGGEDAMLRWSKKGREGKPLWWEARRWRTYRQHPLLAQQWRVEAQMVPGHCRESFK
jgi:hypothetical protein